MAGQRRQFVLPLLVWHVVLMAVCWPQPAAGGSAHVKSSDGGKWTHAHRHHHRVNDPYNNNNNNNSNQDYVQDMASEDNLIDYETDENAETSNNDVNVSDASPLMGVLPSPGSYIPSNCSSCVRREELRRRNLEVIKDQILSKLGMQRAPNMTGRLPPRIPPLDHLLDLYGMQGDAPPGRHSAGHHHAHHQHQQSDQAFQTGPVYDEEDDDFHARTEKVIAFSQLLPHVRQALKRTESTTTKGMESIYFKFSDKVTRSSKVDKANLWLYIQNQQPPASSSASHGHQRHHHHHHQQAQVISKSANANASTVWINIYKVVRVPEGESPVLSPVRMTRVALPPILELVDKVPAGKQHSQTQSGGWVSFEVRKVVAEWFRWPEENLGLVVHAVNGDQHAPPPTFGASAAAPPPATTTTPASSSASKSVPFIVNDHVSADGALVPFVEVVTTDGRKHRTKRTIGLNCDETSSETRCCRYPLTVDFVEFGWDWIIAPKKYEANYCSGECPYVFLQKYPHTHIVQQANPAGTAGPCCAPRKMSPISMLYFDNEFNIIHGNLPGMVVDRCGCS
ncbi:LOW QUALITY PROTEIN: growth/differentiation factor 8-like [Daphnia carinata]|uniref:LOW QUALITY PROTEIN: growth/differentiation factor 8-like n=1 Tax=Daphnia carinata TaxID=120202 RepID=UPI00257F749B|nr:LOW QUALITY PROTEIN: growth/differentiation factor 8-like [Daphnia carinata]